MNPTRKEYLTLLIVCVLFIVSHNIKAETVIQLHTLSYHEERDENFNEVNFGVGLRHYEDDYFLTGGAYKNSERNTSVYGGIGWEKKGTISYGITAGLITGYQDKNVTPFILPFARYEKVSLIVVPYPKKVIHLTFDLLRFQ